MPPRTSMPARDRDYDYSNVGKIGRRTGVVLEPRPLDEHGLEEITGLFSSPRKPSPINNRRAVVQSIEDPNDATTPLPGPHSKVITPRTAASARRSVRGHSHPPPRSASPKKSGITGTARRSGAIDVLANNQLQQELQEDVLEQNANTHLSATPLQPTNARAASARPATVTKRFSPERTPLRTRVLNQRAAKSAVVGRVSDAQSLLEELTANDVTEETPSRVQIEPVPQGYAEEETEESVVVNIMGHDSEPEDVSITESAHQDPESDVDAEPELPDPLPNENDNSDDDQNFEPPSRPTTQRAAPNKANSRRKRKSDALEDAEGAAAAVSSPAAKRRKRRSNEVLVRIIPRLVTKKRKAIQDTSEPQDEPAKPKSTRGQKPLAKKDANAKLSSQRQRELDDVVEKIKARPSAPKSLFVLSRETPADDSVTHTRSGRVSIRPLAYWRNEYCVYSNTPNRAGIEDGARFPMNSIKEVVRSEEIPEASRNKGRKSAKSKSRGRPKKQAGDDEDADSDLDLASDNEKVDPDADGWELGSGTLKGAVASWDADHQTGLPEETTNVEIAHAHAAIQTKEVKGSTFKYAKLLSSRFFGAGVVDLPAGGIKRAKNSRKMHMCFFVVQGRVMVRVGPTSGPEDDGADWGTRFSIGKGGFWQVPRGNQYSIENEHGKMARIFFSQGCEAAPDGADD